MREERGVDVYEDHEQYGLIHELVREIKKEFGRKHINNKWRYNDLQYFMGICGHCSTVDNDFDDLYFRAGCIVLLKYHVFDADLVKSPSRRIKAYRDMIKFGFPLDRKHRRDRNKIMRRFTKTMLVKLGQPVECFIDEIKASYDITSDRYAYYERLPETLTMEEIGILGSLLTGR